MRSFVYLEVFRSRKNFPAAGEGARERLFSSVHTDVVHQFVLRLEGTSVPRTALPETGVRGALRPADVLHRQVRHYLVHAGEQLVAHLPGRRLVGVLPLAAHVPPRRRAHVAQEGVRRVRMAVGHQRRGALVVHVTAPVPALLYRLLREQLATAAVFAQVAVLVRVQRVGLVVRGVVRRWRRMWRRGCVLRPRPAPPLRGHLQAIGREVSVVRLQERVHGGGGRRRRIAPFARHHPRGGRGPRNTFLPILILPTMNKSFYNELASRIRVNLLSVHSVASNL